MYDYLENLARRKSFDALDAEERARVLAEMPREAYEQLRAILLAAPALDAGIQAPAALRERILAGMPRPSPRPAFFQRRVPLWQAAAAATVLLLAAAVCRKPDRADNGHAPVVQVRTDTVYVEKTVWKERLVWRERVIRVKTISAAPVSVPVQVDTVRRVALNMSLPVFPNAAAGTSLGNEPALLDFFVRIK